VAALREKIQAQQGKLILIYKDLKQSNQELEQSDAVLRTWRYVTA